MIVVGDGLVVDLGDAALLCADGAREVAEVVCAERNVGAKCLADGLAVVPGLGGCQQLEVVFDALGDLLEDAASLGRRGCAP